MLQDFQLTQKMKQMSVNPYIIKWYLSFQTDCIQLAKVNNTLSDPKSISTGAPPQGCVSSPVLFTLYTKEFVSIHPDNYI